MMTNVTIHLEFDHDDVSDADVYNYLNDLMNNNVLAYDIEGND
jgi:hypothetical protein